MSTKQFKYQRELMLEQMKHEIAQELGIHLPPDGYYGHMTTYEIGKIGGSITKRLTMLGEQGLNSNSFINHPSRATQV